MRPVRVIYLMAVDFGALFLCGALAYMAWAMPVHNQPAELYLNLVPLLGFFVFGYSVFGLYPGFGLGGPEVLRRLTLVTLFCFVFVAAVTFVLKLPHLYSRMTFVLALSASLLLLPVARYAALLPVRRRRWWKKPVVLIADPQDAAEAVAALSRSEESGYRVVGILNLGRTGAGPGVGGVPSIGSLDDAGEIAALGISTAVVVAEGAPATDTLDRLRLHFRHVVMIKSYECPVRPGAPIP